MNRKINVAAHVFVPLTLLAGTIIHAQTEMGQPMIQRQYAYEGRLNNTDSNQIENFRQAALHNDHRDLTPMIEVLKNPPHIGYTYTTIHALAQLGAVEALPVITSYAQDNTNVDLRNFSKVAQARLVAESETQSISGGGQCSAKVLRFYQKLGMTVSDLNTDMAEYKVALSPSQKSLEPGGRFTLVIDAPPPPHPVGVYAVRELADIVYHGNYKDCANLPEVSQVNFANDYPSALKMRLAPLSASERLNIMLQELSQKTVLTHWDNYEIQLASNEGLTASHAAAALLKKMEADPKQYKEVGFTALVRVMWGTGDQAQAPLVQHLLENRLINTGNLPISDLTNGIKRGREPAY